MADTLASGGELPTNKSYSKPDANVRVHAPEAGIPYNG
jgi:hypothetical protein